VVHVIFNLHLGVGHSVLCLMEEVGHVFSDHHIFKCSVPLLIGQSLNSELIMPDMKVGGKCFKDTERRGTVQVHGTRRKRLHGNPAVCVICSAKAQFNISVCAAKKSSRSHLAYQRRDYQAIALSCQVALDENTVNIMY